MRQGYAWEQRRRAWNFFRNNGGGIVGEQAKIALKLAYAEEEVKEREIDYFDEPEAGSLRYVWEDDWDEGLCYCDSKAHEPRFRKCPYHDGEEHAIQFCALQEWIPATKPCELCGHIVKGHWETLASLGGIIDASRDYRRVIEAELALEAGFGRLQ